MVVTVRDAANLLHVSQKTLYRWIKNGEVPFHRVVMDSIALNELTFLIWR